MNYQHEQGELSVVADYTEDMEDRDCNVTLVFDTTIIHSPTHYSSFTVRSNDTALTYTSSFPVYRTLQTIFQVLSYGSLCILVLSLPHKMLGV